MQQNILVWDTERQAFSEIEAVDMIKLLLPEDRTECFLFLAWLPHIKSVFLYKRKRLEIVFQDGVTYELTNTPYLYDKLFSVRHGVEESNAKKPQKSGTAERQAVKKTE